MEADWEIEIGPNAPTIDALWTGFIDLRQNPSRIHEIEETHHFPPLAQALIRLNLPDAADSSGLWTAKCDVWEPEASDPDEMNATVEESVSALACYLDLLPRRGYVFAEQSEAERWARTAVASLQLKECRTCRADLVIRSAFAGDMEGYGITAYIAACGRNPGSAASALDAALIAFVESLTR